MNGLRVVAMTLLALGLIEGIGCIVLFPELVRGPAIWPVLCVVFTATLLASGAHATRAARGKGVG